LEEDAKGEVAMATEAKVVMVTLVARTEVVKVMVNMGIEEGVEEGI